MSFIIDSHVHLFPERLFSKIYDWFEKAGWNLPYQQWSAERIVKYMNENKVFHLCVLNYVHRPGIAEGLNRWLAELAAENPGLHIFGGIHPDDVMVENEVARCLDDYGFPGIKIHCDVMKTQPDDPRLYPIYEMLLERNKGVIIHAGKAPHPGNYLGFEHFQNLMRRYPELKIQVAHLGSWESEHFLGLLEHYPHLRFDTAGIHNPRLRVTCDQLTEWLPRYQDRILFGSDIPFMEESLDEMITFYEKLDLPQEVYDKLFWKNASEFWGFPFSR